MKYNVNQEIFDVLTPNSCYVLGLLASDGSVYGSRVALSLHEKDSSTIQRVAQILECKNKIYKKESIKNDKITTSNVVSFRCRPMIARLSELGIINNKSMKEVYQKELFIANDEDLQRSFIRGYFDGDGSFDKSYSLRIVGSENLLLDIKNIVRRFTNINIDKLLIKKKHKQLFELRCSGVSALKFLEWVYINKKQNFMLRKHEAFESRYNIYKKRLENIEEANSLRNSGLTFAEIATKMDIANPMSAYKLTKQYNKYKETGYLVIR